MTEEAIYKVIREACPGLHTRWRYEYSTPTQGGSTYGFLTKDEADEHRDRKFSDRSQCSEATFYETDELRDFLNDRDAIIAAVLAQPKEVQSKYIEVLGDDVTLHMLNHSPADRDEDSFAIAMATATAEQHCHALLVALGRWRE